MYSGKSTLVLPTWKAEIRSATLERLSLQISHLSAWARI